MGGWRLPKRKLAIGMPTYGRCLELVDINDWAYGAPATGLEGAPQGKYTRENGFLSSYEVKIFSVTIQLYVL